MSFFRRRKDKKIIPILMLLIIVGLVGFFFFKDIKKASAEWFDQNWFYRQAVTITVTSSASDVSNLDTWFSMSTSGLVTASKLQSDCDDLRFTNANGKVLPYYIDSGCNTTTTKIWVKADLVPKNSTTYTIYAYYGNANAVSNSDSTKFNLYNGLKGYWRMNESAGAGSTLADASAYGNTGTASLWGGGNTSTDSAHLAGKFGNAFDFDGGDDYVEVQPASSLNFAGSFTVSLWTKLDSFTNYGELWMHWTPGSTDVEIVTSPTGTFQYYIRDDAGVALGYIPFAGYSTGVWYNLVLVHDAENDKVRFYINNVMNERSYTSTGTFNSADVRRIGGNSAAGIVDGLIDDVRVYNRALATSEVSQLYNDSTSSILTAVQGQSVPSVSFATEEKGPAPVAAWRFDEGQGLTAFDDSTNNNDGTLSGTTKPTWQLDSQCVSGKCLKFDGSTSYVKNSTANWQSAEEQGTITVWYKTTSATVQTLFASSDEATATKYLYLYVRANGNLAIQARDSTQDVVGGSSITNDGKWHMGTVVSNGSAYSLYVDGVLQSLTVVSGTNNGNWFADISARDNITIGALVSSVPEAFFNGVIDDVKVYPYARTAAQIKSDYNSRNSTSGVSAQIGNDQSYLSNGLVGYWKMDEASWDTTASQVIDSSGAGNNGTSVGNATTTAGIFGNAGTFDGSGDRVTMGNDASLQLSSAFTLDAWVKWNGDTTVKTYYIIEKGKPGYTAPYNGYALAYRYDSESEGNFQLIVSDATNSGNTLSWRQNPTTARGIWYHLTATFNNGKWALYSSGVSKASGTAPNVTNVAATIGNFGVGTYTYSPSTIWDFNGVVDEVRVYNRALSPKEVSDLHNWAPGPVGWWKMDDKVSGNSQTLVDSSTYGNTGTSSSANGTGMSCKIIGRYGGGCSFDGVDDYVDAGNGASLNITGDLTIEGWFKASSVGKFHTLVSKGADLAYNFRVRDTNVIQFYVEQSTGVLKTVATTDTISTNVWYHLVGVAKAGEALKIYINGVLNKEGEVHTDTKTTAVNLRLGSRSDGWASGFTNGLIDDVRIYNYARTQSQILADYGTGQAQKQPAAWWKFDEGYGNPKDQSVNANNGTNSNAVWTNDGKFGKALSFDGVSSYVDMGSGASLNASNITVSVWIKTNADGRILGKNNIDTQRSYSIRTLNGKIRFVISLLGTEDNSLDGNITVTDNKWHHIIGTFDGITQKIYVDGKLDNSVGLSGSIFSSTSILCFGRYSVAGSEFTGSIDEVKIYPFALTADDIKTEYNRGSALQMGSLSDTSGLTGGSVASNSASALYCIPGDTTSCASPVGEWNFNEKVSGNSQTVYDTSGNGNNGTTYYGANLTGMNCKVIGKYGSGCLFDGTDDYIDVGSGTTLNITGAITVEAWVKLNTVSGIQNIVGNMRANNYGYRLITENDKIAFETAQSGAAQLTYSSSILTTGVWYHLVITRSGAVVKTYVNGVDRTTTSGTHIDPVSSSSSLKLGVYSYSPTTQFLNGSIDDVKIFNYARTAAQVAWDYNKGKPLAWWKFDECQGLTAYDSSGNGNTGTITIGTTAPQTVIGTCNTPTDGTGAWYNGKSGKFNSSLSFDGVDDYVDAGSGIDYTKFTGMTLEAWVKRSTPGSRDYIVSAGYDPFQFEIWGSDIIGVEINIDSTYYNLVSTNTFTSTDWSHLVFTHNLSSGAWYIYVNGSVFASGTRTGTAYTGTNPTRIGGHVGGNDGPFGGLIDDVKIYNYALTPAQIKLDYNQGSAVRFGPTTGRP